MPNCFYHYFRAICASSLFLLLSNLPAQGDESPAQRAEKSFLAARADFQKQSTNIESAWKFGRASFDWAEFAENDQQREEIAKQGIEACRRVLVRQPKSLEGHYYLAMNLGQLARTKSFGALKLVDEMEKEFKFARVIDEKFDFGGPDRNLGLLYLEAPGWPTSIGSRNKARQHLERAAKLGPNYPENRLNLIEAYLKWGDKNGAQREFNALKILWPAAKKEFLGEQWESSWIDWERRWEKVQIKFATKK
jgi:tetratricopeptide (TPR) repeat protein